MEPKRKDSSNKFEGLKTICQDVNPAINATNLLLVEKMADFASSRQSNSGDLVSFKRLTLPFLPVWKGDQAGINKLLTYDFQFETRRLIDKWPSDHTSRYLLDVLALFQYAFEGVVGVTHRRMKVARRIQVTGSQRKDVISVLQLMGRDVAKECYRRGHLPSPAHTLMSTFFVILPERLTTEDVHKSIQKQGPARAGTFSCLEDGCLKSYNRLDRASLHFRAEHAREEVRLALHRIAVNE